MEQEAQHFVYALFISVLLWAMDAVPFRQFLIESEFTCADDLVDTAPPGLLLEILLLGHCNCVGPNALDMNWVFFLQRRKRVQLGFHWDSHHLFGTTQACKKLSICGGSCMHGAYHGQSVHGSQ